MAARKKPAPLGTREQLRQTQLLLKISRDVAAYERLEELLQAVVEISAKETAAERGTLFLYDDHTRELYSRVAQGNLVREIRIMSTRGIAGHVYTSGEGLIVDDAYADERFDASVDKETGFTTRTILCVPVKTVRGEIIGVLQMLNKADGPFSRSDQSILEAMATQAAITLRSTQLMERMTAAREKELQFLDVVSDVTSEIDLGTMLAKVMSEATRMLNADRSTLFLHDERKNELFSRIAMGDGVGEIRLPSHAGIAGAVFTSGQTINIPHAYADLRFNPAFDKRTGYFTRSILCVPITNKDGKVIGVTQSLNKRGGPFTSEDESRLKAFTAQVAISLENAKLFDDVQGMKNYNESMLESMSNGVVTLNEDLKIVKCNTAGLRILKLSEDQIVGHPAAEFFTESMAWILDKIGAVKASNKVEIAVDAEIQIAGEKVSCNVTVQPLMATVEGKQKNLGVMVLIEDISSEKRMKSTMARYMDPGLAEQLLAGGEDILGGKSVTATVLFSDVRGFTTISEELGPHGTVSLLNEYFTIMVDCIQKEGGMLDKFIGDAIMAVFGLPVGHDDDEDRAVRATVSMITELRRWNEQRASEGKMTVDMGIGLNTDSVVSGNIGSPKRMDYTIIGDGVNLASRLESACKSYGARILISENTSKKLRGTYRMREADLVVVKGKTEPVTVYEVLDYHNDATFPNLMDSLNTFKAGLGHYRQQRWDKATEAFRECLNLNAKDKLPGIYAERCDYFKEHPPGDDWTGVWVMKSK